MSKKKIMGLLTVIAVCFTVSTVAAELSQETLNQCKNYLQSPSTVTPDATAMQQCYNDNPCGSSAFSDVEHCTANLKLWYWDATAPKPIKPKTSQSTDNGNAESPPSPETQNVQATPENNVQPAPATSDQQTVQPTNNTDQSSEENNQEKKQKPTKSINWF